ncbi:hypothetical protein GTY20_27975 [Streptomyces sp. SID4946]|uniref:hypothetical protein n=1 Tax=Streptomyces sp. LamerLS-31b TaxID=1839765 RepID=UPI00081E9DE3|nr:MULTISPECIES: hypothetical protein [unclassified Streptomyces]MYQ94845.1 hypothetical protein [Streptomyces sp. SID4946]SCF86987.1 hypothetical protein GA0115258_11506 [Streptomyces sp. LamerLS-31b]SCF91804.1 hypothetical protein GA0115256_13267 [Streptomyces sp. DconLS]
MARRGERRRDFRHEDPDLGPVRIGVRQVVTPDSRGKKRVLQLDPSQFACRTLAAELADEWVEYIEVTSRRTGTASNHRQGLRLFCTFVDEQLAGRAPEASLARTDPDLSMVLLAWEQSLPAQWPRGSTRPGALAANIRILINRRQRHPDRDLAPRLAQIVAQDHSLAWGVTQELDEFSRKDKAALVKAAWDDVARLRKRLKAGWDMAEAGGDPAGHGWSRMPDLLWAMAHRAVSPRELAKKVPFPLSPELAALIPDNVRTEGQSCGMRGSFLVRGLLNQLYPNERDLHAFRVLLVAATGHSPEEVAGLTEEAVEFTEGGVRLTMVKNRARRIHRRAFTCIDAVNAVEHVREYADRPRLEVSAIVRQLMDVTAPLRDLYGESPAPLFLQGTLPPSFEFTVGRGRLRLFGRWVKEMELDLEGRADIRRLRKSVKVEKAVAFGGRITDIADDHHQETFRGHYAQGTTLRMISGRVITTAQQSWFDKVTAGPVVLDAAAEAALEEEAAPARPQLGLSAEQVEDLRSGALEMGVTSCRDPFDSPFSRPGDLCAVAPLRCLECRNAWILPSHLPQLLLFADHLDKLRTRLSPVHFHTLWGQTAANLAAVLAERTEAEIAAARRHIAEDTATLQIPLTARAEFDA